MISTDTPKRILITFARSFHSLELARQLHAQGNTIFIVDSINSPITKFSNTVKKFFKAPSPRFNPEGYVQTLRSIVVEEKIDLILPVYEEIACISKATDSFPKSCKVFCPNFEMYETLQNKWLFQQKLKELGIPILKSYLIQNQDELDKIPLKDYALKPCHSRASQHIQKVTSSSKSPSITFDTHNPWIAQEWITGNKFCSYSVCNNGVVNAHCVYPVTYAIGGNKCILFTAIDHPVIQQWITQFVKKMNYTGQIAFDFIQPSDGHIYAIECNPRATSGLLLFRPEDRLDKALFTQQATPIVPQIGQSQQVATGMLMYGWKKSAIKNNTIRKYLKTLLTTKDVVFSFNDLKPFIFEPYVFAKLWMQGRKQGLSVLEYYMHDHDWNGKPLMMNAE